MKRQYSNFFGMGACALAAALGGTTAAQAADAFPTHPIRVIVNTAPGGLTDVTTRLVAKKMSENLNQSVVVENRAGGDGLIGLRAVKAAAPDGYTLLASAGTMALQPSVREDAGYDLLKDFTGVGLMGRSPFMLVEASSGQDKSGADFIARATANPGTLSYASAGVGTVPHLAAAVLFKQLGLNLMHVPYKGNGAAMGDVMSGRVDVIMEAYGSSGAKVKAGQLTALALTSPKRATVLPDVPALAELGAPEYSYYTWLGMVAPAGTPKEVVDRLSIALRSALDSTEVQQRFREDGVESLPLSPDEFNNYMAQEVEKGREVVTYLALPKL
ncbi:Extra-cytoplasmic solute receptor [Bordetella tumbae]|uniref:Bug family tripartite tricarboxylate transporter substrate binding protein n=1 Tax=Bordetella tumbae TaxID=1649139 RepID=UPI0039F00F76